MFMVLFSLSIIISWDMRMINQFISISPVAGFKMLRYIRRLFYSILWWSVAVPMYLVLDAFAFSDFF